MTNQPSEMRRLLGNTRWLWMGQLVSAAAGVAQVMLLSRAVGPEGLGTIAIFAAVCGLAQSMLSFTSGDALMTFATERLAADDLDGARDAVARCYVVDVLGAVVVMVLVNLIASLVLPLLHVPSSTARLLHLYAFSMPLSALIVLGSALMRVRERFSSLFWVAVAANASRVVVAAGVLLFGWGVAGAVVVYVTGFVIEGSLSSWFALGGAGSMMGSWRGLSLRGLIPPRAFVEFELHGFVRTSLKSASRYLDSVVIGLLAPPAALGLYRVCKQMLGYLQNAVDGLSGAAYTQYASLWHDGRRAELRRIVGRLEKWIVPGAGTVALGVGLLSRPIVLVLLGPRFADAAELLPVLAGAGFVLAALGPVYMLPAATGDARPAMWSMVLGVAVQAGLAIALVPKWGGYGAAWSYVGYVCAWAAAIVIFVRRGGYLRREAGT